MSAGLEVVHGGKSEGGKDQPGSKAWMKKVRAEAKELAHGLETHHRDLARMLYTIYDTPIDGDPSKNGVFTAWGYSTFRDYAEQELSLHYKKAESLRRVHYWRVIELAGLDPALGHRLDALGWTKNRVLSRLGTRFLKHAKQWIEKAEKVNYPSLEAAVKKYLDRLEDEEISSQVKKKGDPIAKSNKLNEEKTEKELEEEEAEEAALAKDPDEQLKSYDYKNNDDQLYTKQYVFKADQIETVKLAIKRAQELSNVSSPGHNISLICLDYLATNDFTKASEEQRLRYVAKLEKSIGLKFIVIDPATKDILYGLGTLEKVAKAQDSKGK